MSVLRALVIGLALLVALVAIAVQASAEIVVSTSDVDRAAESQTSYDRLACRRCWDWSVAVPVWIPGVTGTMAEGSISVSPEDPIDKEIEKLFEGKTDLTFAFVGALEARYGRWSFHVNAIGARVGADVTFTLTDGSVVNGDAGALIGRGFVGYEAGRGRTGLFGKPAWYRWGPYAGVRYYHVDFDFDLPLGLKIDRTGDWWDPIVGLSGSIDVGRWTLGLEGDIGGFGVGSDFAWWVSAQVEYHVNSWFSIALGYAVLSVDFADGESARRLLWDVTLSGPMLALRFHF